VVSDERGIDVSEPVAAIDVLLVEDDPGDVLMTREAFQDYKLRNNLWVATNGVEAMQFLRKEGEHADAPTPDLILLDLNLPKMDGREVLAAVKEDPALRSIPVVVLTTSEAEEDVVRSYSLHANAYVTKPVDFERFVRVVQQIDDFFVSVVRLPRNGGR
jgi:CheY-like chemotaxis protein